MQLKGIDPQLVQTGRQRDPGDRPATGPRLRRRRHPAAAAVVTSAAAAWAASPAVAAADSPVAAGSRRRRRRLRVVEAVSGSEVEAEAARESAGAAEATAEAGEEIAEGAGEVGADARPSTRMEGPLNFDYPGMDAPSTAAGGSGQTSRRSTTPNSMAPGSETYTDSHPASLRDRRHPGQRLPAAHATAQATRAGLPLQPAESIGTRRRAAP